MAAKEKFRVPSADEMERSSFSVAPLFPSYKRLTVQKSDIIESDVKKTDGTLKPSSAQQQIALAPCHLASNDSSKSNEITKTAKIEGADLLSTEQKHLPPALLSVLPKPVQTLTNSVIVNPQQRGNVILKHIRNVPWEFGNIVPDYEMGKATCGIFLSLRYHQLHPEYIHNRLKQLGKSYDLRVLLAQVDLKEPHHILKELNKICILANCTLVLAFSPEEAGRYLETYKIYENKPADAIMEKSDGDYMSRFTDCLTTVKSVNKTDCINLISSFKSLNNIMNTSREALSFCPGFGPQKAQRLYDVFHEPFLKSSERN